jgi:uncharacterized protein (UPF0147 family)
MVRFHYFSSDVSELPIALKRNFAVMRELDEKAHVLRGEIQAAAREKLDALRAASAGLEVRCAASIVCGASLWK